MLTYACATPQSHNYKYETSEGGLAKRAARDAARQAAKDEKVAKEASKAQAEMQQIHDAATSLHAGGPQPDDDSSDNGSESGSPRRSSRLGSFALLLSGQCGGRPVSLDAPRGRQVAPSYRASVMNARRLSSDYYKRHHPKYHGS